MLRIRLVEMEAEKLARDEAQKALISKNLPPEAEILKGHIEHEVGLKLGQVCPPEFKGWLTYRRLSGDLVVIRGRAFKEPSLLGMGKWRAGLDVPFGLDTATEMLRGFDVTPPQSLDHLMVNFGCGKTARVFLWYGENIAPYRLIFEEELEDADEHQEVPQRNLIQALEEGMGWVLNKPKHLTLPEFFKNQSPG